MRSQGRIFKRCGCVNPIDGRPCGSRCPRLAERWHGSWYFAIELPTGRDGRRRQLRRGGYRTRAAAEAARAYLLGADADCGRGLVTVGRWLDLWLETRKQTLSYSGWRIYTQHVRDYLKPRLGGVPLSELSVGKVQAMFASLIRLNGTRGRPLSAAEADLPPIRLHDLRHGAASLSLAAGNELRTVQAMLGHSSFVFTADTYTSVLPSLAHEAAEATAELVLRAARMKSAKLRRKPRRVTRRRPHRRTNRTDAR